jgi:hypothetical protein
MELKRNAFHSLWPRGARMADRPIRMFIDREGFAEPWEPEALPPRLAAVPPAWLAGAPPAVLGRWPDWAARINEQRATINAHPRFTNGRLVAVEHMEAAGGQLVQQIGPGEYAEYAALRPELAKARALLPSDAPVTMPMFWRADAYQGLPIVRASGDDPSLEAVFVTRGTPEEVDSFSGAMQVGVAGKDKDGYLNDFLQLVADPRSRGQLLGDVRMAPEEVDGSYPFYGAARELRQELGVDIPLNRIADVVVLNGREVHTSHDNGPAYLMEYRLDRLGMTAQDVLASVPERADGRPFTMPWTPDRAVTLLEDMRKHGQSLTDTYTTVIAAANSWLEGPWHDAPDAARWRERLDDLAADAAGIRLPHGEGPGIIPHQDLEPAHDVAGAAHER